MTGIRTKVDDSTLEVGWISHSSHGDSMEPFISENRVGIKDDCHQLYSALTQLIYVPLVKLVRTYPGEIQLTLILLWAHSTASDRAMCRTAALEKLYGVWGWGTLTTCSSGPISYKKEKGHTDPDMEPIMTIDPPSGMSLEASSAQNQVPMTLMSSNFRIFSVG